MKNKNLLAFFGHHKAGTTWINSIVKQAVRDMGLKHAYLHRETMFSHNLKEFVNREKIDCISYVNADFEYVKDLDGLCGFHVIRDPRDIVVSAYFSHLYSHKEVDEFPELKEYREKLKNLSKDEGLIVEMVDFRKKQFELMYNWDYSLSNIKEVKMEDLIYNPYDKFIEIFKFLKILNESTITAKDLLMLIMNRRLHVRTGKVFPERLLGFIYQNSFSKKSGGRDLGEENVKSHYRKGLAGDWKNHFNEEHKEVFKDNYNHLLIKLGYESSSDW